VQIRVSFCSGEKRRFGAFFIAGVFCFPRFLFIPFFILQMGQITQNLLKRLTDIFCLYMMRASFTMKDTIPP